MIMMKRNIRKMVSTVAALVIVLGGFGVYSFLSQEKVASIVLLDVNPSIELRVDEDADVIEAIALNEDAEKVLAGMKLKGTDADTAVNAIIGSLLKNGYVDELANSILLSVEDDNTERGAKLQAELTAEINEILGATSINAAVLAQYIDDAAVEEMADEYDISKGKATLIKSILEANDTYAAKDLAKLSVNELNLILTNPKNEVKNLVSTGNASDSAYIGNDEVKASVFEHAKVKESDVRELEIEFDYEYGKMVYEVEFSCGEYEYDYSVDAETGEILHSHREYDDDYVAVEETKEAASSEATNKTTEEEKSTSSTSSSNKTTSNKSTSNTTSENKSTSSSETTDIGEAKAKSIALDHAGYKESKVSGLKVEREYDDGQLEYHVEFRVGNKEYDYEISAKSGKILDYDVDVDDDAKTSNSTTSSSGSSSSGSSNSTESTDIGKAKAKAIALEHAGVTESQVTSLNVERDVDDGNVEYSVEFTVGNKEYDYEIDGATGKILDYDVETEDD